MMIKLTSGTSLNIDRIVRVCIRPFPHMYPHDVREIPEDAPIWRAEVDLQLFTGGRDSDIDYETEFIGALTTKQQAQMDCDDFCREINTRLARLSS